MRASKKQENYDSIKNQLNGFISELANQKSYVLIDAEEEGEEPFINKDEKKSFEIIINSPIFAKTIHETKKKLGINDAGDNHDFAFSNKEDALEALTQIVAGTNGYADPDGENLELSDREIDELITKWGEDMWWVYAKLGEKDTKLLKKQIENEVDKVLQRNGMQKSWFPYVVACLLGIDFLNYHIVAKGEHTTRLKITKVEKDFVDLRIYKGAKKSEFSECWEAIQDYITHNIPVGLVRVKDESTRLYNEKINGTKTSIIQAEYDKRHSTSLEASNKRNVLKLIKRHKEYKTIKPY